MDDIKIHNFTACLNFHENLDAIEELGNLVGKEKDTHIFLEDCCNFSNLRPVTRYPSTGEPAEG